MLKLQYFGHLMQTDDSLEQSLMLGKIEDRRRREHLEDEMAGWQHRCKDMNLGKLQDVVRDMGAWRAAVHGVIKRWARLSD